MSDADGRRRRGSVLGGCLAVVLFLVVAGCASSPPPVPTDSIAAADEPGVAKRLRTEIRSWVGTPHRLAGACCNAVVC